MPTVRSAKEVSRTEAVASVMVEKQCEEKGSCGGQSHKPDVKSKVCQSCEHLYSSSGGVILSPSSLVHSTMDPSPAPLPSHPSSAPHPSHPHTTPILYTPLRLWTTRRYGGLCECGEEGGQCRCAGSSWPLPPRPHLPSCWPRMKVALLVVGAILPWAFLVIYLVLTYTP